MSTHKTFLFLALITFLFSCEKEEKKEISYSELELEILELINQHRAGIGKTALKMNRFLFEEALEHTYTMISVEKMSHDGFNERAEGIWENVGSGAVGENVAYGYTSASSVVEGWLNSQGHRENIEGNYTMTGIAARSDKNGRYYFTQIFLDYK